MMTRRQAVIGCLVALVGQKDKGNLFKSYGEIHPIEEFPQSLRVLLSGSKKKEGISVLTIEQDGREITLTAKEIWEALQPHEVK